MRRTARLDQLGDEGGVAERGPGDERVAQRREERRARIRRPPAARGIGPEGGVHIPVGHRHRAGDGSSPGNRLDLADPAHGHGDEGREVVESDVCHVSPMRRGSHGTPGPPTRPAGAHGWWWRIGPHGRVGDPPSARARSDRMRSSGGPDGRAIRVPTEQDRSPLPGRRPTLHTDRGRHGRRSVEKSGTANGRGGYEGRRGGSSSGERPDRAGRLDRSPSSSPRTAIAPGSPVPRDWSYAAWL